MPFSTTVGISSGTVVGGGMVLVVVTGIQKQIMKIIRAAT